MTIHPRCPCSRASLRELEAILLRSDGRVDARVLMCLPADAPSDWKHGGLWTLAASIPGVTVLSDPDGREARKIGAVASGHTVLIGPSGTILFSGGITFGRGHEGDNDGVDAILSHLTGDKAASKQTPVFGCSLQDPTSEKGK